MPKMVQKAWQKFEHLGDVYTAKSFIGASGIEYPTQKKAVKCNPNCRLFMVKNVEFGGCSDLRISILIEK